MIVIEKLPMGLFANFRWKIEFLRYPSWGNLACEREISTEPDPLTTFWGGFLTDLQDIFHRHSSNLYIHMYFGNSEVSLFVAANPKTFQPFLG